MFSTGRGRVARHAGRRYRRRSPVGTAPAVPTRTRRPAAVSRAAAEPQRQSQLPPSPRHGTNTRLLPMPMAAHKRQVRIDRRARRDAGEGRRRCRRGAHRFGIVTAWLSSWPLLPSGLMPIGIRSGRWRTERPPATFCSAGVPTVPDAMARDYPPCCRLLATPRGMSFGALGIRSLSLAAYSTTVRCSPARSVSAPDPSSARSAQVRLRTVDPGCASGSGAGEDVDSVPARAVSGARRLSAYHGRRHAALRPRVRAPPPPESGPLWASRPTVGCCTHARPRAAVPA